MRLSEIVVLVLAAGLMACGDDGATPTSPLIDEPEVPRAEHHLLIEKYSRTGDLSWYTMTPSGSFYAPFPAPSDAVRLIPSPDGKRIAYVRLFDDLLHLWVMDRDGGSRQPLLEGELLVEHVSWSPDGTRLVLQVSTLDDEDDIAVINADGTGYKVLAGDGPGYVIFDRHPEWSPDGSRILFLSDRDGGTRLYTMNPNGGDVQEIATGQDKLMREPRWSRDGAWIAFDIFSLAGRGVGVVRANGQDFLFVPVAGDVGRVAWLPDGRLAYSTNPNGAFEIYARNLATGVETNLTLHTDHDFRVEVLPWATLPAWKGLAAPAVHESGAQNPSGVAAGDVDGDGFVDIVVASPGTAELRLLKGSASGLLPFGGLTASADITDVRVANVAGGVEADIVALGADGFHIWKGAVGGPLASTFHGVDGVARTMAVADIDRDAWANVVLSFDRPGTVGVTVGIFGPNGPGDVIQLVDAPTSVTGAGGFAIADATGEGDPDLLMLSAATNTSVMLMKGQGAGGFSSIASAAQLPGADARDVPLAADFDGDRRADVAVLRPGLGITVMLANGQQLVAPRFVGIDADDFGAADVDRDGDVDLVGITRAGRAFYFVRNLGDGMFASPVRTSLVHEPARMTVADVDGDFWPDVIMVTPTGRVIVARNRGR